MASTTVTQMAPVETVAVDVTTKPNDSIFDLMLRYAADPYPDKIDLAPGI